jgi:hypothetical protein
LRLYRYGIAFADPERHHSHRAAGVCRATARGQRHAGTELLDSVRQDRSGPCMEAMRERHDDGLANLLALEVGGNCCIGTHGLDLKQEIPEGKLTPLGAPQDLETPAVRHDDGRH